MLGREVVVEGSSMCEKATHFGAGRHGIHVSRREVKGEVSSVRDRARIFGTGPTVLPLLNRLYRY